MKTLYLLFAVVSAGDLSAIAVAHAATIPPVPEAPVLGPTPDCLTAYRDLQLRDERINAVNLCRTHWRDFRTGLDRFRSTLNQYKMQSTAVWNAVRNGAFPPTEIEMFQKALMRQFVTASHQQGLLRPLSEKCEMSIAYLENVFEQLIEGR